MKEKRQTPPQEGFGGVAVSLCVGNKEVFKVAETIPHDLKISHRTTKYALRKAMEQIVPPHRRRLAARATNPRRIPD